jgi:polyferredoxin
MGFLFNTKPLDFLAEPQSQDRRPKRAWLQHKTEPVGTGLTREEHQSDQCALWALGDFGAEDTCWGCMACIDAKQGAVPGYPSDDATTRNSQTALRGCVPYYVIGLVSSIGFPNINLRDVG